MPKKAFITGITGQDGAYLSKLLLEKGYRVYGAFRRTSDLHVNRLKFLGIEDQIEFLPLELLEFTNIHRAIEKVKPDEIYNLGAQSFVALSFEEPVFTADVTAIGPLRVLEAIRAVNPKIRFYQASSSEMFGKVRETPQNEKTPFYPRSPYAASKLFAHWMTVNYRESYGMFACSGILFNHESPLRGLEFVTRKITNTVAKIKHGLKDCLMLGNLDSKRDWGYAPEYVTAMWLMLKQSKPDDYVIATGEPHSVREFVETAFKVAGFDIGWSGKGIKEKGIDKKTGHTLVKIDPQFFRPAEVDVLKGDYSKAKKKLGWSPKTTFRELVSIMVRHDLNLISKG
ncbi:MAG: GDP-mannose 4,6-dehydratase [Nitrospirae bacterium]|nr:GDP-mannose 4,6-dehydratase [Nitrospirota bacterium]